MRTRCRSPFCVNSCGRRAAQCPGVRVTRFRYHLFPTVPCLYIFNFFSSFFCCFQRFNLSCPNEQRAEAEAFSFINSAAVAAATAHHRMIYADGIIFDLLLRILYVRTRGTYTLVYLHARS